MHEVEIITNFLVFSAIYIAVFALYGAKFARNEEDE